MNKKQISNFLFVKCRKILICVWWGGSCFVCSTLTASIETDFFFQNSRTTSGLWRAVIFLLIFINEKALHYKRCSVSAREVSYMWHISEIKWNICLPTSSPEWRQLFGTDLPMGGWVICRWLQIVNRINRIQEISFHECLRAFRSFCAYVWKNERKGKSEDFIDTHLYVWYSIHRRAVPPVSRCCTTWHLPGVCVLYRCFHYHSP